jgi:hypothetical protein
MLSHQATRQAEAELQSLLADTSDKIDQILASGFLHAMERDRLGRAARCLALATNRVMRPGLTPKPLPLALAELL